MTKPKENPSRTKTSKMTCTLEEFQKVSRALPRMSEDRKLAIKQIMVYGASPQAVAEELGVSRNAIHKSVFNMYKGVVALRMNTLVPSGWARVEMIMPRKMIQPLKMKVTREWNKVFGEDQGK
jgi:hypothetical protein